MGMVLLDYLWIRGEPALRPAEMENESGYQSDESSSSNDSYLNADNGEDGLSTQLYWRPPPQVGRNASSDRECNQSVECSSYLTCAGCAAHVAAGSDVESRAFRGVTGAALLLRRVLKRNLRHGPARDKQLSTGRHTIVDVFCKRCHRVLGWMYLHAYQPSQVYKTRMYCLELAHLVERAFVPQQPP